ncbi:FAD-dependent oxidoreductase [Amycolatopsis rhabdoformis]|uniref:FAD-dependent oxidoreductase n=1 Tax=Amycolatopsis rhabdoformis TaxID=1448059 RepID=A0ABZ1IKQ0_9PSEU|nr:FAD-dependent oxidoreductase [Amycolatopsis rhabdoformis]WSE34189.1 FAD-dependent oxidoreductase [Amycolatopsis rhabdoformis]
MVIKDLARWAHEVKGAVLGPEDERFGNAGKPWNLTVPQRPGAVVVAADVDDVVATVRFAAEQGIQVAPQGTGHGAIDSTDGAILLRTGGLNEISVDPARRRARVGAGARWRDLQEACTPHGLSGLATNVPSAGVTGYTLGGGLGLLARRHGLAAHGLVSAELVTGDGELLRVDAEHHADLWWALRGGGTPPGVVTELEIELAEAPELFAGDLIWPADAAVDLFGAYRSWSSTLPEELTTAIGVHQFPPLPSVPEPIRGQRAVTLTVCFLGTADAARRLLQPMLEVAQPMLDSTRPRTPDDLDLAGVPADGAPVVIRTEILGDLPESALAAVTDLGPQGSPLSVVEFRRLGGALARPADAPAALDRIEGEYFLESVGLIFRPEDVAVLAEEQGRVLAALEPAATGRTLRTFAGAEDRAVDRFFAPDVAARLGGIARRYDPGAVVHDPLDLRSVGADRPA